MAVNMPALSTTPEPTTPLAAAVSALRYSVDKADVDMQRVSERLSPLLSKNAGKTASACGQIYGDSDLVRELTSLADRLEGIHVFCQETLDSLEL
jgi:hypothetical protein